MIVKQVTFVIKEQYIEKFIEATLENQKHSKMEKGILAFDFLKCTDEAAKFLLNEEYESEEAMNDHLNTEHFKKWINAVEEWFEVPRERVTYVPVGE